MNQPTQDLTLVLKAGVGVSLNEKWIKILVKHIVKTKKLKCVLFSFDLGADRANHIIGNQFHLFVGFIKLARTDANFLQILPEGFKRKLKISTIYYFIAILVFTKVTTLLLHGIIGQVNHLIVNIIKTVFG